MIKLIEEQCDIRVNTLELIGRGFDNNVYRVNGIYTFRIPVRKMADELIRNEGNFLPILKRHVAIDLPKPEFFGKPVDYYPYHFLGYRYLEGVAFEYVEITDKKSLARTLAQFLSELHSIPIVEVDGFAGPDKLARLDIEKRKPVLLRNLEKAAECKLPIRSALFEYANELEPIGVEQEEILQHGDLHVRNLLFDRKGRISSVIDYGDFHIGNRACDLNIVYSLLDPESRCLFYDIYGQVPETTMRLARFKAIFMHLFLLLHAEDTGNRLLTEKLLTVLDNALL